MVECTVSHGPSSTWTSTPVGSAGVTGVETFVDADADAVLDADIDEDRAGVCNGVEDEGGDLINCPFWSRIRSAYEPRALNTEVGC